MCNSRNQILDDIVYKEIKHRIFEILENDKENDKIAQYLQIFIISLILLNVVAVVLESVQALLLQYYEIFLAFEIVSVTIFSIEYIFRLWVCTENQQYQQPILGRIRYAFTPFAIIDLLAILPFFLPFLIPVDLRFMRILRLTRIFRTLKLVRYSDAFSFISRTIKREKYVIAVIFLILTISFIFASTLMYYVEYEAQPDAFSSIPHAMWWAVVTLTTVGYGDIYPITALGRVLASAIAILGIGFFALPAGIIAAGFIEEVKKPDCSDTQPDPDERISSLERLANLKERGHLSDEEFDIEKQKILQKR